MRPRITRGDLLDIIEYEKRRPEIREAAIATRRRRRIQVGPFVTLAFESVDTVKYQIQEMMRAERMVDDEDIDFEIETYSGLLPGPAELSAALFIEIDDPEKLHEWLPALVGIEDSVDIAVDGAGTAHGEGERGRSKGDVTSTVHYLRFPLSPGQTEAVKAGARTFVSITLDAYVHRAQIGPEALEALARDLS